MDTISGLTQQDVADIIAKLLAGWQVKDISDYYNLPRGQIRHLSGDSTTRPKSIGASATLQGFKSQMNPDWMWLTGCGYN